MKTKLEKILIANRGEIALRVIRACREMGIGAVAVYSEVDARSPHVLAADQAVEIGPAPPLESYLNMDRIIEAARSTGCQAVHPGYGFLAENARFAHRCREAGLIFIGPSPEAMERVGDKLTARATMEQAGIPLTPGAELEGADEKGIRRAAEQIGYPVMIKASAGGGGKGMRIVHQEKELLPAVEACRREARTAFGDDRVYMEKFIQRPRHVEFQVLADHHGHVVHLFERECSIQRRHQKIVEETPSPALDEALRRRMGETACRVMEAVGYTNAGTVEFLLDEQKNFYFLEVNARIQVEHPITELVTGVDLVKQQIRIAAGEPLSFRQEDLHQRGHAIECRIYAEDPENNFLPSIGKLLYVREPRGPGIRCDSGIDTGMEVTMHYDPILAKLIAWDADREGALRKMDLALSEYVILGVKTCIPFLQDLLRHPEFVAGNLHTGFIARHFSDWKPELPEEALQMGLLIAAAAANRPRLTTVEREEKQVATPWHTIGKWELFSG
ncbi:MAG: acetyl-CoA carboxylase biotin carboxylase subunit [Calditrichaeota bacterium]|nr:MAG: acetyl-CoA carboxylase biotin carboxylase subunit [Calditrichota bacterium]